ncbi:hypothetical protein SLEP1_g27249 [Rubroshorea leprosula]|uniref:ABC transporter domain-containing protein n=1 Tax=Rubroshorea leprosula TaxID=152421 RepID=A0AAV5JVV3_9ROSI|nr:hypothetical protein SLEP1_g27249 [Rubroshorea leprosula]
MADIENQNNEIQSQQQENQEEPAAIFFSKADPPFEDVVYKIEATRKKGLCGKTEQSEEKVILNGVTGMVCPGEIVAMLGPSGSGKTTLLTALGGRLGSSLNGRLGSTLNGSCCSLTGSITYNGKRFSNPMKRKTGFVTQDDVLYPHLTVEETLVFTALLRLPNTLKKKEKVLHAEAVITKLGLTKCKNSIIGDTSLRGISGGERKRVSIGQEMLINPSLLFLDEPTSGLDSTTAQRIVSTLWELAKGGRTVVMTIHQPSSRLFYMFHKVLLLSEGNPLYFGKGSSVMDYFHSIGYSPSVTMNPSDFLLDLANGVSSHEEREEESVVKQTLISAYKTNLAEKSILEIESLALPHDQVEIEQFARWSTTWWQQFTVLLRRGVKERRYASFSRLKIAQVLVISFLVGLLWWQSNIAHLQDQIGLLFYYSGFWSFSPMFNAIFTFPQERMMLEKERSSGMYRLSSYFLARTFHDLPMELALPTIFVTITYWMAGFKHAALHFLHTLSVLLYNVLVSQGLGLAIGAMVMDQKSATMLGSVIMLSFELAGGYYVQHVPPFIAWIKYGSITYNSYKLLIGSQFKTNETYPCGDFGKVCSVGEFPSIKLVGLEGQALAAIALGIMLVGYRLIAYIALMRIGVNSPCLRSRSNVVP